MGVGVEPQSNRMLRCKRGALPARRDPGARAPCLRRPVRADGEPPPAHHSAVRAMTPPPSPQPLGDHPAPSPQPFGDHPALPARRDPANAALPARRPVPFRLSPVQVLGESFEGLKPSDAEEPRAAAAGPFPTGKFVSLAPLSAADTLIRHCSFELFVAGCGHHGCDDDFNFKVVPALNKAAGSVSFQSTNFPSKYVSAAGTKGEPARAMVVLPVDKDAASFAVVAGLSDSSKFSFKTHGTSPAGFLTATTHSTGDCAAGQKGDVVVAEAPMDKAAATWETHTPPPPPPPPLNPWGGFASPTAKGSAQIVSTAAFHGKDSLALHMTGGKGVVGLANRGLGHEGLVFEAGKDYEGFFFALSVCYVRTLPRARSKLKQKPVAWLGDIWSPGATMTRPRDQRARREASARAF